MIDLMYIDMIKSVYK